MTKQKRTPRLLELTDLRAKPIYVASENGPVDSDHFPGTGPTGPGIDAADTSTRWCRALTDKNFEAMMGLLAHDAVLRTPVTDQFPLRGRDGIATLVSNVLANVDDFEFYLNLGNESRRVVAFHATTHGFQFEEFQSLHINDDNYIDELVLAVRPLAGVTAVLYGVGTGLLGTNRSPRWRRAFTPFLGALAHGMRFFDRKILLLAAPPLVHPDRLSIAGNGPSISSGPTANTGS